MVAPYQQNYTFYSFSPPRGSFVPEDSLASCLEEGRFPSFLEIKGEKIWLIISDQSKRALLYAGQQIHDFKVALEKIGFNSTSLSQNPVEWAIIAYHLTESDYEYIYNIDKFKEKYELYKRSSEDQIYSIEEISLPRLDEQKLIFYVQKQDIPYRVTVSFSEDQNFKIEYQLLNYEVNE